MSSRPDGVTSSGAEPGWISVRTTPDRAGEVNREVTRLVGLPDAPARRDGRYTNRRDRINPAIAGGGSSDSARPIWSGQVVLDTR